MRNESGFSPVGVNQPEAIRDNPIAISQASWLNSSHKVQANRLKRSFGIEV